MMNSDPSKTSSTKGNPALVRKIWKRITHQWGWKLGSLLLALLLWGSLISQDSALTREKVFNDVNVNIVGAEDLQKSGFIVVDGLEQLSRVRIKADVPQRNYTAATEARYAVRLDLTQIKSAGEQTVKLTATSTSAALYGAVTDISVPQITVTVEECVSKHNVPVEIEVIGQVPQGYYAYPATSDPTRVDITGPRSVVDQVVRCVITLDLSALNVSPGQTYPQPIKAALPFSFQDLAGNTLDDTHLTVRSQNVTLQAVTVSQQLYPTLRVRISADNLLSGRPKAGYEVKKVTVDPEYILIAAVNPEQFEGEDTVFYPSGQISVENADSSVTGTLSIVRRGGSGNVVYMSEYEVHVVAEIGPVSTEKTE